MHPSHPSKADGSPARLKTDNKNKKPKKKKKIPKISRAEIISIGSKKRKLNTQREKVKVKSTEQKEKCRKKKTQLKKSPTTTQRKSYWH